MTLMPGLTMRGNFYKCGDRTEKAHYGMWRAYDRAVVPKPISTVRSCLRRSRWHSAARTHARLRRKKRCGTHCFRSRRVVYCWYGRAVGNIVFS